MAEGPSAVRLLVGLGNPGPQYDRTRHNAGFWFVEELADRHGAEWRAESRFQGEVARLRIDGADLWLLAPQTYMNRSGDCVAAFAGYYKIDVGQILVAHDDLDLPPGTIRLKRGGGHGGHNGLRSLIQHLGQGFLRLRVGIGHPGHKDDVVDYVLSRPSGDDRRVIDDALERAVEQVPRVAAGELERAMHALHSS